MGLFLIVMSFVVVSYLIQTNPESVEDLVAQIPITDFGTVFVLIVIIGTIFVPLTFLPIIPITTFLYGWVLTGFFILIGQIIGSIIAFGISRKYGLPLVSRIVSMEDIDKYESKLPEGNLFWAIVFIRIALPLDVLSYILGLFGKLRFRIFALATLLGLIPSSFMLAYLGGLELKYQLIAFAMFVIVILIGYGLDVRYRQPNKLKKLSSNK